MNEQYRATLLAMVCELCRQRGMTDKQVASLFSRDHIKAWFAMKSGVLHESTS